MGSDSSVMNVRATVVQASTIFYDTPATLGSFSLLLFSIYSLCTTLALAVALLTSSWIAMVSSEFGMSSRLFLLVFFEARLLVVLAVFLLGFL